MQLKFEEMALLNPSNEVRQACDKFFFKAYENSSKEEKDKLLDVMLKHLVWLRLFGTIRGMFGECSGSARGMFGDVRGTFGKESICRLMGKTKSKEIQQ